MTQFITLSTGLVFGIIFIIGLLHTVDLFLIRPLFKDKHNANNDM
jgi:hypothetical protein